MNWIVVQLSSWAEKKLDTKKIAEELRRRTGIQDLELYYPCTEDAVGKHTTAYSEYLFVEQREGASYSELEGNEIFQRILRTPDGQPSLVDDHHLEHIRQQIAADQTIHPGETVEILKGPYKGNLAEVIDCGEDGHVILRVAMGDDISDATIPGKWVRRKKRNRPHH